MKTFPRLIFILTTFIILRPHFSQAQDWKDVASIFYDHCSTCHRPGEIGPFPIMSYHDVTSNPDILLNIKTFVKNGDMPPWKADPEYHHFLDERILSQTEIDLISAFVDAGGPAGDTTLAPPPPVFPSGSQLGIPDVTLTMAEPFITSGTGLDEYMCFVLPTDFLQEKLVSGIEFRPGNGAAVHHSFLYLCPDSSAYYLDLTTPEYGYPSFGGAGDVTADFLGLYGPGMIPRYFPAGGGIKFPPNSFFIIQVHYAPLTYQASDVSSVNLFFSDQPTVRNVIAKRVGEGYITNGPFLIHANEIDTFHSTFPIASDRSLFAIAPHQHLLGYSYKIWAELPGGDSIPLVSIPKWDFHWQMLYSYPFMIKLPQGTNLHATAIYDNTIYNPNNPNNPPEDVHYGEGSEDEMFKYLLNMLDYQEGDEFLIIDSNWVPTHLPPIEGIVASPQFYPFTPNPADQQVMATWYLPVSGEISLFICDVTGKLMEHRKWTAAAGYGHKYLETGSLQNGLYWVIFECGSKRGTKPLVVSH